MNHGSALEVDRKIAQTADESRVSAESRSFWERHGAKLVLSILLGLGITWILSRGGLPLIPPKAAFGPLKGWTIPAYLGTLCLLHYVRAIRWRHLLRPVGQVSQRSVLAVSWIAFAAILLSPFRSGEIVRPYLITRRSNIRIWEAAGTVGAERVMDGLVLSLMLFAGLQ